MGVRARHVVLQGIYPGRSETGSFPGSCPRTSRWTPESRSMLSLVAHPPDQQTRLGLVRRSAWVDALLEHGTDRSIISVLSAAWLFQYSAFLPGNAANHHLTTWVGNTWVSSLAGKSRWR